MLAEFLEGIKRTKNGVNYTAMANILIVHSQNAGIIPIFQSVIQFSPPFSNAPLC